MTCQQLTELVTDHLEGRLSRRARVRFQLHLGFCRHCRAYLRQMRQTIVELGRLPATPIPDAIRDELLGRFRTWKQDPGTAGEPPPPGGD